MGETLAGPSANFNGSLRIEPRPERLTSEAGAIVLRGVLELVDVIDWIVDRVPDPRDPTLITHPLPELLRTALLLIAQGWRDQDDADADALRDDPAFRLAVSNRKGISPLVMRPAEERANKNPEVPDGLASQPTLSRLYSVLARPENSHVLREALLLVAARRQKAMRGGHRLRYATIDIDTLPIDVHGHQPGSAHNGHYRGRIYHPLVASIAETGDLLDIRLRPGNVHGASGALEFITSLVDRVERELCWLFRRSGLHPSSRFPRAGDGRGAPARLQLDGRDRPGCSGRLGSPSARGIWPTDGGESNLRISRRSHGR